MLCFTMFVLFCVCMGFAIKHQKTRQNIKDSKIEWGYLTDEEEKQKEEADIRYWSWMCAAFVFEVILIGLLIKAQ